MSKCGSMRRCGFLGSTSRGSPCVIKAGIFGDSVVVVVVVVVVVLFVVVGLGVVVVVVVSVFVIIIVLFAFLILFHLDCSLQFSHFAFR